MNEAHVFTVPKGLSRDDVAKTFAAYLLGANAHNNFDGTRMGPQRYRQGPYQKEWGDDRDWQLDDSNDFWLHFIEDNRAWLNFRYEGGREKVEAMLALFKITYGRFM